MGTLLFICNVLNTIWYFQSSWISNKLYTRIVAMHLKTSTLGPDVAVFAFFRSFAKKQLQTSFSFVFEFSAPNDVTITSCCNVANNYNAYWFLFDGIEWRFLPHIFHTKTESCNFCSKTLFHFKTSCRATTLIVQRFFPSNYSSMTHICQERQKKQQNSFSPIYLTYSYCTKA